MQWAWAVGLTVAAVCVFLAVYIGPIPVRAALVLGGAAEAVGFAVTFLDLVETEHRVRRFLTGPRDITLRLLPIRVDLNLGLAKSSSRRRCEQRSQPSKGCGYRRTMPELMRCMPMS